jgi:hypothetical protein
MGRLSKLKRQLIEEANNRVLNEAYSGIINRGDDICEIICKRKLAKSGSNGDVVKYIQHLLAHNEFNTEYGGGGMGKECADLYEGCDGKFRRHTKDAVKEFQRRYKLSVDGVVGYNTWKAMCDNLEFTESLPKKEFCKDCQCNEQDQPIGGDEKDTPSPTDDFRENELEIIDCDDLKYCVGKHLYQTSPDILAFYKCVSDKVNLPDPDPLGRLPRDKRYECNDCPPQAYGDATGGYQSYKWEKDITQSDLRNCIDKKCTEIISYRGA